MHNLQFQPVNHDHFPFSCRAILLTASEDNAIRVWGHPNRLKRDTGQISDVLKQQLCNCQLPHSETMSTNTDSLAAQGRMSIEEFLGIEYVACT